MIFSFIQRRIRRNPLELQLTAMIDIFSMIVIFLIFGTVFGASDIIVPSNLRVPSSYSKEAVESAVRLVIEKDKVRTSLLKKEFPLSIFRSGATSSELTELRGRLVETLKSLSLKTKASEKPLNVIADRDTPYEDVFDVIRVFREAGFDTLLFVAHGEAPPQ